MNVHELLDQLVAVVGDHLLRRFKTELATREASLLAQAERQALTLEQDGANGVADYLRQRIVPLLSASSPMSVPSVPADALPSPALPEPGKNGQAAKRRGRPKAPRGIGVEETVAHIAEQAEGVLARIDDAAVSFNGAAEPT